MIDPSQFIESPGLRAFNDLLAPLGAQARIVFVPLQAGVNLGRRPLVGEESLDTTVRIESNYRGVALGLGANPSLLTASAFVAAPHELPDNRLAQLGNGAGYMDQNPQAMATVYGPGMTNGHTLFQPIADAPGGLVYYVAKLPSGELLVVTAVLMMAWHRLSRGLVRSTMRLIQSLVHQAGAEYDPANLHAFLSPGGTHESFEIDERGRQQLIRPVGLENAFMELTPEGDRLFDFERFVYPVPGLDKPYTLDLAGLAYWLMVGNNVPRHQIYGLYPQNTMTTRNEQGELVWGSKRTIGKINAATGKHFPSSGIVGVINW